MVGLAVTLFYQFYWNIAARPALVDAYAAF
jgi:hypothetical protein